MSDEGHPAKLRLRALLVYRSRKARMTGPELRRIRQRPSVHEQYSAVLRFAREGGWEITTETVWARTNARFRPESDLEFRRVRVAASKRGEVLIMDDAFRLFDVRELELAIADAKALRDMRVAILSAKHRKTFHLFEDEELHAELEEKFRQFATRSKRIKVGLAKWKEDRLHPTKRATARAAQAKRRTADDRAKLLMPVIERVRSGLPANQQSSLATIAHSLNETNVPTPSGRGRWQSTTVKRVLDRAQTADEQ